MLVQRYSCDVQPRTYNLTYDQRFFWFDSLLYVHSKQFRSCRDGQLLSHTVSGQVTGKSLQVFGTNSFADN